uniref:Uncharacterized protein n=1 Tax=viral metagenome TaxID=1070528 RepID=A0A6C0FBR8_9ZZZZ|tara:strand:- start:218 stop:610 length:393 start_codon:yes stop_codon:yes gene_type:complete
MNLNVEHVLMFALVVCAFYYLMGKCSVEGYGEQFCETKFKECLCKGFKKAQKCIGHVNDMVVPGVSATCINVNWDADKVIDDLALGPWYGEAPFCDGKCPDGYTECETSITGDGSECWSGHKVRCARTCC